MPTSTTASHAREPLDDWSHRATDIPDRGLDAERAATPEELVALAAALELAVLARLNVAYRIRPVGGGRHKVKGELFADVTQACIVTLQPVHADIHEVFEEEFWPEDQLPDLRSEGDAEERAALADSAPEAIRQGLIEVGRLIYEQLSTAIDPYPRSPGAEFAWRDSGAEEGDGARDNPFASLAVLKNKA